MATPDNLNLDYGGLFGKFVKERFWLKVIWPDGDESQEIEVAKCENVLVQFSPGEAPTKKAVQVVGRVRHNTASIEVSTGCAQ